MVIPTEDARLDRLARLQLRSWRRLDVADAALERRDCTDISDDRIRVQHVVAGGDGSGRTILLLLMRG